MKPKLFMGLVVLAAFGLISCGGGGGGGSTAGTVPTDGYTQDHLTGIWSYECVAQDGSGSFSGSITINSSAVITSMTNTSCTDEDMGNGFLRVLTTGGYVKGRIYEWCGDDSQLVKFSAYFNNTRNISGIVDYHYSGNAYIRYDLVMNR
jgi:hypothetical protein